MKHAFPWTLAGCLRRLIDFTRHNRLITEEQDMSSASRAGLIGRSGS
jgi:hypothetical protein